MSAVVPDADEVTYPPLAADALAAHRLHRPSAFRTYGGLRFLALANAAMGIGFAFAGPDFRTLSTIALFLMAACLVCLAMLAIARFWTTPAAVKRNFEQLAASQAWNRMAWSDAGLAISAPEVAMTVPWERMVRIRQNDALLLFYVTEAFYYILPKRHLTPGQLGALKRYIASVPSKARRFQRADLATAPLVEADDSIDCVPTLAEVMAAHRLARPSIRRGYGLSMLLLGLGGLVVVAGLFCEPGTMAPAVVSAVGLGLLTGGLIAWLATLVSRTKGLRLRVTRAYASEPALRAPHRFTWTGKALAVVSPLGTAAIPWGEFARVRENRACILLYQTDAIFHAIPKRLLSAAQLASLRACVLGCVAKG